MADETTFVKQKQTAWKTMKRNAASYSTTVVEEEKLEEDDNEAKSNATLKLKRPKQTLSASKRLAFELSQYSTQQEILTILVDIERELPLETLEEVEFAIQTLWERLYESEDVVVKAKIISLLGSLARFPGVNINPIVDSLLKILNSEGESCIFFCVCLVYRNVPIRAVVMCRVNIHSWT